MTDETAFRTGRHQDGSPVVQCGAVDVRRLRELLTKARDTIAAELEWQLDCFRTYINGAWQTDDEVFASAANDEVSPDRVCEIESMREMRDLIADIDAEIART